MALKLKVPKGTTYAISVTYSDESGVVDITNSTILFTVKSDPSDIVAGDTTAVFTKTVTVHTDPTAGESTITLVPSDTRLVAAGDYYYDIKIDVASDDAEVYVLQQGVFTLQPTVTNREA